MRLLLLSDIHANQTALEAVLRDAGPRPFDEVVHLGDALGYGPHPREVLNTLRDLNAVCLLGNHEQMLLDYVDGRPVRAGGVVADALLWQRLRLSEGDLNWVRGWPDGLDAAGLGARYRHGTPVSLDTYTDSVTAAREAFGRWEGRLGFVGHTHLPAAYATLNAPVGEWIKHQAFPEGGSYLVPPGARVILNPGSVGQPRDGNPRASYALFDSDQGSFEVFRVAYDVGRAQEAALEAGLPPVLAARLAIGK